VALVNSSLGVGSSGVPVSQLISAGLVTQSQVLAAVTQALGTAADLLSQSQITSLLSGVTGKVTDLVGTLTGQSGSYSAQPELSISVPANTPGGSYRGQMTVTLMDK
jgi:hypothetical protein